MRNFRRLAVFALLFSSFFMTGCDVNKILDVVTKVAEGVQKAMPAIKEVVNTIQTALPQDNKAAADDNTAAANTPTETNATNNANTVITNPTDQEDLADNTTNAANTNTNNTAAASADQNTNNTNANNTNNTNNTANPAATSQAETALASYSGGRLTPAKFGQLFGPIAKEASLKSGVPPSIILAQAALETGWGSSSIGNAKNLFGIKGTGPAGSIRVPTREVVNGRSVTEMANFRKYNSWQESIEDHGRLLQNSRYAAAMRNKNNPDQFARELQKAGYATDPQYASKLISIMKSNNFYQYNN